MKRLIRNALGRLGYEVRRRPPARPPAADPADAFARQRAVVAGVPSPTVFDVGAHAGETVLRYRALLPSCVVYAFEPFPETFRVLADRVAADPAVRPRQVALDERPGTVSFHGNASTGTNSILPTAATGAAVWGAGLLETVSVLQVPATTIDAFCAAEGIERIDVLKLDTQGTEERILRGAARMLAEGRVGLVYAEVLFAPTYVGQGTLAGVLGVMGGHGYALYGLYNLVWSAADGRLAQADAIFVRG